MPNLGTVMRDAMFLSMSDKLKLIAFLTHESTDTKADKDRFIEDNRFSNGRYCAHCNGTHIVRRGLTAKGTQRFFCKDCGKSFTSTTGTVTSKSKLSLDKLRKYVECIMYSQLLSRKEELLYV